MKTYLDCYPCFLRQALSAARRAGASSAQQHGIVLETMDRLKAMPPGATPPDMADGIHRLVRARTKNPDPYRQAKTDATRKALALLPRLRELVRASADPLETAVRIAIAKGQANYETLSASAVPICFLLQAKCPVIGEDLGVEQGDIVVKSARFS